MRLIFQAIIRVLKQLRYHLLRTWYWFTINEFSERYRCRGLECVIDELTEKWKP